MKAISNRGKINNLRKRIKERPINKLEKKKKRKEKNEKKKRVQTEFSTDFMSSTIYKIAENIDYVERDSEN